MTTYSTTVALSKLFEHRYKFDADMNTFSLRHDKDNELLSDAIGVIYVELSKLDQIVKKPVNEMTELEKWAVFFEYADIPSQRERVNKIIESKEALQMAGDLLMSISQDEKERAVFRSRRMYQTDMDSNMATAERRGEIKGRAEGRAEGRVETARNLKSLGVSTDLIIKSTGLSQEEIAKL